MHLYLPRATVHGQLRADARREAIAGGLAAREDPSEASSGPATRCRAAAYPRPSCTHALLRRYWYGLAATVIDEYDWDLCQWDRFSQVTKRFQSVFQRSAMWFRRSAALLEKLDGRAALREPPPVT